MKLNNLGNETLPQLNSLVRIKTEVIDNRTIRNTRQLGYDLQGNFANFQLGVVCGQRGIGNYDVIAFRNQTSYNVYTLNIDFLEVICSDITVENNIEQFIKLNSIISFDDTMLSDSQNIYPMTQRLSHERLNDMEIEEIQKIYSYEQLTTHLIKALMAIASLEERFKIIKDASGSREDNKLIDKNVAIGVAKSNGDSNKRERNVWEQSKPNILLKVPKGYTSTSDIEITFSELEEPSAVPSEAFIEDMLSNKSTRR